jgi:hypothetical protein
LLPYFSCWETARITHACPKTKILDCRSSSSLHIILAEYICKELEVILRRQNNRLAKERRNHAEQPAKGSMSRKILHRGGEAAWRSRRPSSLEVETILAGSFLAAGRRRRGTLRKARYLSPTIGGRLINARDRNIQFIKHCRKTMGTMAISDLRACGAVVRCCCIISH